MDVSFSNVVEGTRQYFLGLPKASPSQSSTPRDDAAPAGQPFWSEAAPPAAPAPSEGALAQSGAPAMPTSRPPSVAAAHPPRPPSADEPLEPEPHIIHKATVMREALQKQREEERAERDRGSSPPSHIIHKPPHALPAAAPAPPAEPAPSPRPAQVASPYRLASAPTPPAPYLQRYRPPSAPAPSAPHYSHLCTPDAASSPRHAPQLAPLATYARSAAPNHHALGERAPRSRAATPPPPPQQQHRYPPLNDRVPPILHPPQPQRLPADSRSGRPYGATATPSGRAPHLAGGGHDRHPTAAPRKHDVHAYAGYATARSQPPPTSSTQSPRHYADARQQVGAVNSHTGANGAVGHHYPPRPPEPARAPPPPPPQSRPVSSEASSRNSSRSAYQYAVTSTQSYPRSPQVGYAQQAMHRAPPAPPPKPAYDSAQALASPPRASAGKSGFASHQPRPTVSVTSLVNQMNQTKQKRESPLDLSVKTVKNSADSTAQDDADVSDVHEHVETHGTHAYGTPVRQHLAAAAPTTAPAAHYAVRSSHKVDFSPNFHSQYTEKSHRYVAEPSQAHAAGAAPVQSAPQLYNGAYENTVRTHAPRAVGETYIVDNRYQPGHPRYTTASGKRIEHPLPRIDLTQAMGKEQQYRDARHAAADDSRKRLGGHALSNVPPKLVRYETWSDDSRIERSARLSHAAQEQHKLMSQPVYSYSSHKQFEAYQSEQRRAAASAAAYHASPHYQYPGHTLYSNKPNADRYPSNSRNVIQKVPSQRELQAEHSGVPADKRVLSILRNSLETKSLAEPARPPRRVTELIVIDDDPVADADPPPPSSHPAQPAHPEQPAHSAHLAHPAHPPHPAQPPHHAHPPLKLHTPRAVDSIRYDSDSSQKSNNFEEFMAKQKKIDLQISPEVKNKSPDSDVASRIRTKAELKGFTAPAAHALPRAAAAGAPLPTLNSLHIKRECPPDECARTQPKSQKAHLFRQLEVEQRVRLDSVIKKEGEVLPHVKSEPMNIEEIEKDAVNPIDVEKALVPPPTPASPPPLPPAPASPPPAPTTTESSLLEDDFDWTSMCNSFIDQLKTGCGKKKSKRKRVDTAELDNTFDKLNSEQTTVDSNLEQPAVDLGTLNKVNEGQGRLEKPPAASIEYSNKENKLIEAAEIELDAQPHPAEELPRIVELPEKRDATRTHHVYSAKEPNEPSIGCENKTIKRTEKRLREEKDDLPKSDIPKDMESIRDEKKEKEKAGQEPEKKRKSIEKKVCGGTKDSSEKRRRFLEKETTGEGQQKDLGLDNQERGEVRAAKKKSAAAEVVVKTEPIDEEESQMQEPTREQLQQIEKSVTVNVVDIIKSERAGSILLDKMKQEAHEPESTDDDEPLIKSKLLKDQQRRRERSAGRTLFVKLECCASMSTDLSKTLKDSSKDAQPKTKLKQKCKARSKSSGGASEQSCATTEDKQSGDTSPLESESDEPSVASRLRLRKSTRSDDSKASGKAAGARAAAKPGVDALKKPGFGDGSDFHPGWEEEVCKYKRSLRMPSRLIRVPRSPWLPTRLSSSLPDLDPSPVSPAPSLCAAAAPPDSDLDSNSSYTHAKLCYDSEASSSTVLSYALPPRKKNDSILDILIQKYGRKDEPKRKHKDDARPKPSAESSEAAESKAEQAFRGDTDAAAGKRSKQRASIKEVFGDERPASAPPSSCRDAELAAPPLPAAPAAPPPHAVRPKPKKLCKDKLRHKSNSIRDGLRSTSLKKCDAKGRLLRLRKRNNFLKSFGNKKLKELPHKAKKVLKRPRGERGDGEQGPSAPCAASATAAATASAPTAATAGSGGSTKRLKRLFARRKLSSGFDYIRKKKKLLKGREEETAARRLARRGAAKPRPESVHDIQKEIKGWFINKSVGETPLHRAARLGYTDCVAYCLEVVGAEASARDNAGFTPLHVAAARGHLQIARLLLQYGANVSAAAQGGIRPLHEASENEQVETVRLLLSYGADPLLATYAGQAPAALADAAGARRTAALLRRHVADVQGRATEPWRFPHPLAEPEESGCDALASPPPHSPPPPDAHLEIQCSDAPLPPFYSLKPQAGAAPAAHDGLWCLLQDVTSLLQIKSRDSLLKQIHCGAGSPRELLRELRTAEFLERAQCHQLLGAGEKVNVRASKVALVRLTDKLRQLLRIETTVLS